MHELGESLHEDTDTMIYEKIENGSISDDYTKMHKWIYVIRTVFVEAMIKFSPARLNYNSGECVMTWNSFAECC